MFFSRLFFYFEILRNTNFGSPLPLTVVETKHKLHLTIASKQLIE